ncbi:MAG: hypothetical protein AAF219_11250 [Myxococcota bacterium]
MGGDNLGTNVRVVYATLKTIWRNWQIGIRLLCEGQNTKISTRVSSLNLDLIYWASEQMTAADEADL